MLINLEQEQKSLQAEINKLELQIAPIQKKLQELRERRSHINALLPAKIGSSIAPQPARVKYGFWAELCRHRGWPARGNSAHRVVIGQDPNLHSSIPHKCDYDNRTYP